VTNTEIGRETPAPRDTVALIDEVFLRQRGRTGSMRARFPHVLGEGAASTLWVAREGATVVSCLVVHEIDWLVADRWTRVGLVGFVCTADAHRGRGLSSELLRRAAAAPSQGREHLLLWTTIPGFYSALGWTARDASQLGMCVSEPPHGVAARARVDSAGGCSAAELEPIRERWAPCRVRRDDAAYAVVPPSASDVLVLRPEAAKSTEQDGFALVGVSEGTAYLYDLVTSPEAFTSIWPALRALRPRLLINSHPSEPSFRLLKKQAGVQWSPQNQAMWFGAPPPLAERYIPYLDRI